ncbi:hypothetical protein M9H77_03589 [Catharanthus roseus]|uniref:Uncharacterized protein n=1 Tax=Catharanthus roseus TaxID=4058 RepID=A0ACC0CC47_CATRO|nr:hypothetical protein M9H77_03589 [Catharanthus roseus]
MERGAGVAVGPVSGWSEKGGITGLEEKVPLKGLENVKLLATLDILNPRPQEGLNKTFSSKFKKPKFVNARSCGVGSARLGGAGPQELEEKGPGKIAGALDAACGHGKVGHESEKD